MGQKRIAWDTEGQRDLVKNGLLGTHRWCGVKTDVFGGQWGACRSVGWVDFSVGVLCLDSDLLVVLLRRDNR
jgi:hypothetical protein